MRAQGQWYNAIDRLEEKKWEKEALGDLPWKDERAPSPIGRMLENLRETGHKGFSDLIDTCSSRELRGSPGLPIPNNPCGLCGRKATLSKKIVYWTKLKWWMIEEHLNLKLPFRTNTVLCCVVLCCAMLCYAMLCYGVLWLQHGCCAWFWYDSKSVSLQRHAKAIYGYGWVA